MASTPSPRHRGHLCRRARRRGRGDDGRLVIPRARVVRTGAWRLCVAPAPAAASSHQSDVSRRDADIGSAGGGAAAAGGGGGGEAAGASPSRASAAAGECRRELGSFFYEGSWAVGRGDRGGDGGGRREPDGKTGSGDRGQAGSGARAHSGM